MRTMFHHVDCLFPGVWLAGEDHSTTLPVGDVTLRVPEVRRTLSLLPPEVNTTVLLALRWFCQKNDQHIHINGVWEPEYQTVEQYWNQTYSLKLSHRSRHFSTLDPLLCEGVQLFWGSHCCHVSGQSDVTLEYLVEKWFCYDCFWHFILSGMVPWFREVKENQWPVSCQSLPLVLCGNQCSQFYQYHFYINVAFQVHWKWSGRQQNGDFVIL